jgi:hypothetical protein
MHEARTLCRSQKRDVAIYAPLTLFHCLSVPVRLAENGVPYHFVDTPPKANEQTFPVVDLPVKVFLEKPSRIPNTLVPSPK